MNGARVAVEHSWGNRSVPINAHPEGSSVSPVPVSRNDRLATLLVVFVLGCAVFGDRVQIKLATGGRGALPLLDFVVPVVAGLTVLRYGRVRCLAFMAHPAFVVLILPYLVFTALFPILGVMFTGYPERTLLSIAVGTSALSFMILGSALSRSGNRIWSRWLLLAIALQLVYSLGQTAFLSGGFGAELFAPFHAWDLSLADIATFVQSRSTGLYLNPNELGLFACFAVILALTLMKGRLRVLGVMLAILILLLSESRGAGVALAAALLVGVVVAVVRGQVDASGVRAAVSIVIAGAIAIVAGVAVAPQGPLGDRFGSLFAVLAQGPQADVNLSGRLDYWAAAIELNAKYPWGTFGPPEFLLGTALDSSWFSGFAQGSIPYVLAIALLLIAPFFISDSRHRLALWLVTVLVGVAAITQTPLNYPVIVVFWVLLGACLESSLATRASLHRFERRGPARLRSVVAQTKSRRTGEPRSTLYATFAEFKGRVVRPAIGGPRLSDARNSRPPR
jgi:hypothetical protein